MHGQQNVYLRNGNSVKGEWIVANTIKIAAVWQVAVFLICYKFMNGDLTL